MKAYCEKCRVEREMNNPKPVKMSNGRQTIHGICSKCGAKIVKTDKR